MSVFKLYRHIGRLNILNSTAKIVFPAVRKLYKTRACVEHFRVILLWLSHSAQCILSNLKTLNGPISFNTIRKSKF